MPRPKSFDPDTVLDRAMDVFRTKGYEGASIADLTGAMGINRFSLYDTFGDKHELYLAALDRYQSEVMTPLLERIDAIEHPDDLRAFFSMIADHVCASKGQPCCLMQRTASGEAATDTTARKRVRAMRDKVIGTYQRALQRLRDNNHLSKSARPDSGATTLFVLQLGLLGSSAVPPPRQDLQSVIDLVLGAILDE